MSGRIEGWTRQGEEFWRAHHEAWKRSDLNQREYCAAQRIPLKSFGNWRAQFKLELQPLQHKLLHRRGGLSHSVSHRLSHMTNGGSKSAQSPIIPPAPKGRRRNFSEADKRSILGEVSKPGASLSAVARRYGVAARVVFRWKQEMASATFLPVEITDGSAP